MNFYYGQRVRCISPPDRNESCVGLTGTVYSNYIDKEDMQSWVGVEFDSEIASGHLINDEKDHSQTRGHGYTGWFCPPKTLIPFEESINVEEII